MTEKMKRKISERQMPKIIEEETLRREGKLTWKV